MSLGKVLVTGGTGFLGSVVARRLRSMGVDVRAVGSKHADLSHPRSTEELFATTRPQTVIHCAALCGGIGYNRREPYTLGAINTLMACNVVQACIEYRCRLIALGSVCAYPCHCPTPFRELDLWNGYPESTNAAYGNAKRTLIDLALAADWQHGLKSAVVIPTNLYGPGDDFGEETSHVIPALICRTLNASFTGGPLRVWGSGRATRDFLHVEDAARGVVLAAEALADGEALPVMNLGSGEEVSIAALAGKIAAMCGYDGPVEFDATQPDGQPRRVLDSTLAKQFLRWEPTWSLDEGLADTAQWYVAQIAESN